VSQLKSPYTFIVRKRVMFDTLPEKAVTYVPFGHWDWQIHYSSKELALFEVLADIKTGYDFDFVDKYFEAVMVLRSNLLNELLVVCTNVKVKRLFLWFGKRYHHQWWDKLDMSKVNLGTGKRGVVKGGVLDGCNLK